jgi:divalent metal cation (Fe/Co/Zn/Cd) transporter
MKSQARREMGTFAGLIVSCVSLSFMFYLWNAKKKLSHSLNSQTMAKDADCSLACIKLSGILFAGSLLFILFPSLWWVDQAAAIALSFVIGKEGWETIKAARHKNFSGGCGCAH